MIRTILIDDELAAISVLSDLLKRHFSQQIEIVGTSVSPFDGRIMIEELQPDLVFLDIKMPGMTGVELVKSFEQPSFRVIFVSAFDTYAVEAFKVCAIDYLLKPVDSEDLINAVGKVKAELQRDRNIGNGQMEQLKKMFGHFGGADEKIGIAMSDKIVFVNRKEIMYCEAHGSYTDIFLQKGQKITATKPLGEIESELAASNKFFRIHHSYLINLNRVKEFRRHDGGHVVMENDKTLEVSQRRRKEFLEVIGGMVV